MNSALLVANAVALAVLLGFISSPKTTRRQLLNASLITCSCKKRLNWPSRTINAVFSAKR